MPKRITYVLQFDPSQYYALKRAAVERGEDMSVLVREGVEHVTGVESDIRRAGRPKKPKA
jgi:hypothetical protein